MSGELTTTTSTMSYDREKFLAAQLVSRSMIRMVAASLCDKVQQPEGTGETAYFVRYKRMNLPVTELSDDGADPSNSSFSLEEYTATPDEWGDVVTITARLVRATSHPIMQKAMDLLADNAARVMDREIQVVWLAGTNVRYGDGSVASRSTITSTMVLNEATILAARVQMVDAGVPPKGMKSKDAFATGASGTFTGPSLYVAVAGPQVLADISRPSTSMGTWAAVGTYGDAKRFSNFEIGIWMNIRWVETNFIPKFTLLGNSTPAAALGADAGGTGFTTANVASGHSLVSATTYYWKITRKDLLRGFEEAISIIHSTSPGGSGDNEGISFTAPSTAGYVYNVYFGDTAVDADLFLVSENLAASGAYTQGTVPTTGTSAPANINVTADVSPSTVHVVYIHGDESCKWLGFWNTKFYITKDESIIGNVLRRKRSLGYDFFGKACLQDQIRLLRLELASTF